MFKWSWTILSLGAPDILLSYMVNSNMLSAINALKEICLMVYVNNDHKRVSYKGGILGLDGIKGWK